MKHLINEGLLYAEVDKVLNSKIKYIHPELVTLSSDNNFIEFFSPIVKEELSELLKSKYYITENLIELKRRDFLSFEAKNRKEDIHFILKNSKISKCLLIVAILSIFISSGVDLYINKSNCETKSEEENSASEEKLIKVDNLNKLVSDSIIITDTLMKIHEKNN